MKRLRNLHRPSGKCPAWPVEPIECLDRGRGVDFTRSVCGRVDGLRYRVDSVPAEAAGGRM